MSDKKKHKSVKEIINEHKNDAHLMQLLNDFREKVLLTYLDLADEIVALNLDDDNIEETGQRALEIGREIVTKTTEGLCEMLSKLVDCALNKKLKMQEFFYLSMAFIDLIVRQFQFIWDLLLARVQVDDETMTEDSVFPISGQAFYIALMSAFASDDLGKNTTKIPINVVKELGKEVMKRKEECEKSTLSFKTEDGEEFSIPHINIEDFINFDSLDSDD